MFHPANAALSLNKDGWFRQRWYQSADLDLFAAPNVERLGRLDDSTYADVIAEVC